MNSVKLLDTKSLYKNVLYFFILITNYEKEKLRKQSRLQLHQKNPKIPRKKCNQDGDRPVHRKL